MLLLTLLVSIRVSLVNFLSLFFNGSCVLRMAIATHHVGLIVIFVVGIPYYWLAIFTIELINGFNCTMARTLSTRELRPAECAKRLIIAYVFEFFLFFIFLNY